MQCWEEGLAAHEWRGSYRTDAAVAVAEPWAAIQEAALQRMLGGKAQHQHRY
jgi:hypothetical protein